MQSNNSSGTQEPDQTRLKQKEILVQQLGKMDQKNPQYDALMTKIRNFDMNKNGRSPDAVREYQNFQKEISKANRSIMAKRLVNLGSTLLSMGSALVNGFVELAEKFTGGAGSKKNYDLEAKGLDNDIEEDRQDPQSWREDRQQRKEMDDAELGFNERRGYDKQTIDQQEPTTSWKDDSRARRERAGTENRWDEKLVHQDGPKPQDSSENTRWQQDKKNRKQQAADRTQGWDNKAQHAQTRGHEYRSSTGKTQRTRSAKLSQEPDNAAPDTQKSTSRRNSSP